MKNSFPQKLAFVDVETTGSNPRGDRVMEIGVVRVEDNKVVTTMNTLINPLVPPPEFIVNMTGINPYDLETAPEFYDIAEEIMEILDDAVFVAHNARFDYAFIKNEFLRHGMTFNSKVLCTVKLARRVYPGLPRYNLDSIIQNFGIICENRHRAYDDAHCLWDFYEITRTNGTHEVMSNALSELLKAPSFPSKLDKKQISDLPEGPGVYIFYGNVDDGKSSDKSTLYVGKSINIKDRVRSHFSSDYQNTKDIKISQYIDSIEVIQTAGELGALLRESNMVKNMQPIFNRQLRRNQDMVAVLINKDNGFMSVDIEKMRNVSIEKIENILGVFRSYKKAKDYLLEISKEYELCPKIMGLEKTKSSCFNYQLGKCKGACVGEEDENKYNLRFIEALCLNKVPDWPFEGAVAIEENTYAQKEIHLIDKWCYLGSVTYQKDNEPDVSESEIRFDWDVFNILKKFILKKRTDISIKNVTDEEINYLFLRDQGN